ncbi:hypothetical protein HOG17_02280 [Candidatus Peregrinibacteria bacterium]|nr:hypothetical protein [Candidatus Peregrinibacteria bacterium]MBT4147740.1 hypothetical protein [Candidatus Peregrinibacteria bacterium]MBT4365949.1 hypothetical protein [Candidatus Peregrinibacteria bacterium]MBT4456574.1 hypothetical protein [Candidatus Peregrinibacteria bacterium]
MLDQPSENSQTLDELNTAHPVDKILGQWKETFTQPLTNFQLASFFRNSVTGSSRAEVVLGLLTVEAAKTGRWNKIELTPETNVETLDQLRESTDQGLVKAEQEGHIELALENGKCHITPKGPFVLDLIQRIERYDNNSRQAS